MLYTFKSGADYIYLNGRSEDLTPSDVIKHYWGDQSNVNVSGGAYSVKEDMRNAYRILVGEPEGKRSLGRTRQRCEDSIQIDRI
jgi:hypothetical protein